MKLSSPKLKNLYFRRELERPENQKFQRECVKISPKEKLLILSLERSKIF